MSNLWGWLSWHAADESPGRDDEGVRMSEYEFDCSTGQWQRLPPSNWQDIELEKMFKRLDDGSYIFSVRDMYVDYTGARGPGRQASYVSERRYYHNGQPISQDTFMALAWPDRQS